jgi:hypothetical protein
VANSHALKHIGDIEGRIEKLEFTMIDTLMGSMKRKLSATDMAIVKVYIDTLPIKHQKTFMLQLDEQMNNDTVSNSKTLFTLINAYTYMLAHNTFSLGTEQQMNNAFRKLYSQLAGAVGVADDKPAIQPVAEVIAPVEVKSDPKDAPKDKVNEALKGLYSNGKFE